MDDFMRDIMDKCDRLFSQHMDPMSCLRRIEVVARNGGVQKELKALERFIDEHSKQTGIE